MDGYIKRVDALESLNDENLIRNLDSVFDDDIKRYARSAQRCIARVPVYDVRENVHGEWRDVEQNLFVCENCLNSGQLSVVPVKYKFCPNCGAVMDGGADE